MVRRPSGSNSEDAHRHPYSSPVLGDPGDVRPIGEGVFELRVDHGPGYRVYFIQKAEVYVVLLAGGDKSTQEKDIRNAKALAREL